MCTCNCICVFICICSCNRLLLLSTSRSTTAAITTTTAITILLGHLRHTKSQQSPLPRGGQVLPRRSRPTLNRSGCSPTRVRRGWVPPHSIPSVRGPQAEEHRGVRAASLDGKRRCTQQILQFLEVSLRMWQKMTFSTLLLLAYGPCKVYQGLFLKLSQT